MSVDDILRSYSMQSSYHATRIPSPIADRLTTFYSLVLDHSSRRCITRFPLQEMQETDGAGDRLAGQRATFAGDALMVDYESVSAILRA